MSDDPRIGRIRELCEEIHGHGADSLRDEIERLRGVISRISALLAPVVPPTEPTMDNLRTPAACLTAAYALRAIAYEIDDVTTANLIEARAQQWEDEANQPPTEPTSHGHWQHRAGNVVETYSCPGLASDCPICAPTELDEPTKEQG